MLKIRYKQEILNKYVKISRDNDSEVLEYTVKRDWFNPQAFTLSSQVKSIFISQYKNQNKQSNSKF